MENRFNKAWVVRPYPHGKYRMREFIKEGMVAIGWPALGDLSSLNRNQISEVLRKSYYNEASLRVLGQVVGIVDRFVNEIEMNHCILVPDGNVIYLGEVSEEYRFHSELQADEEGYAHWIRVNWLFDSKPVSRSELPATLFGSLKGRQTVFGVPPETVRPVIEQPERFIAFEAVSEYEYKYSYIEKLSKGLVPGINHPAFEKAVLKVLSFYFPTLLPLATTNAPVGADTDLIAELPGSVVIRVQVKCFQDSGGLLEDWVVTQLRDSMDVGQNGIIVTTNRISESARKAAGSDREKPIGFIDVSEFAKLIFDNILNLSDKDLWILGLRRSISGR